MIENNGGPIPDEEWEAIVNHVPIVSVDLIVRHAGGIVLGKRTNEPVKGEWFVPGGTVLKHETLEAAVERVAKAELGCPVSIERRLGVYEHFYDTAEIENVGGKHYVAVAYVVAPDGNRFDPDDQHSDLRVFPLPVGSDEFHPYVTRYLDDIGALTPK